MTNWRPLALYSCVTFTSLLWAVHQASLALEPEGAVAKGSHESPTGAPAKSVGDTAGQEVLGEGSATLPPRGDQILEVLLASHVGSAVLLSCGVNVLVLAFFGMKDIFLGNINFAEAQKLVEQLLNHVVFKFLFLITAMDIPEISVDISWLLWYTLLCLLKIFYALAAYRFERLSASPSLSLLPHLRTFSLLVLVLAIDLTCVVLTPSIIQTPVGFHAWLLLNFESLRIATQTTKTLILYALNLPDIISTTTSVSPSPSPSSSSTAKLQAAALAWIASKALPSDRKASLTFHASLVSDLLLFLLSFSHFLHVWYLHNFFLQVYDMLMFFHVKTLGETTWRLLRTYHRRKEALQQLNSALCDASEEELRAFDDECAVCKEPLAQGKKLPCSHIFHLECIREWLDQASANSFSCPTCRAPMLPQQPQEQGQPHQEQQQEQQQGVPRQPQQWWERAVSNRFRGPNRQNGAGAAAGGAGAGGGAVGGERVPQVLQQQQQERVGPPVVGPPPLAAQWLGWVVDSLAGVRLDEYLEAAAAAGGGGGGGGVGGGGDRMGADGRGRVGTPGGRGVGREESDGAAVVTRGASFGRIGGQGSSLRRRWVEGGSSPSSSSWRRRGGALSPGGSARREEEGEEGGSGGAGSSASPSREARGEDRASLSSPWSSFWRSLIRRPAAEGQGEQGEVEEQRVEEQQVVQGLGVGGRVVRRMGSRDPRMAAMVGRVQEILPHVPDSIIVEELRRTGSVIVSVNNLIERW